MAPSTGDEYDSDQGSDISDEDNRPLTQGELKQRIMKGVSQSFSVVGDTFNVKQSSKCRVLRWNPGKEHCVGKMDTFPSNDTFAVKLDVIDTIALPICLTHHAQEKFKL